MGGEVIHSHFTRAQNLKNFFKKVLTSKIKYDILYTEREKKGIKKE